MRSRSLSISLVILLVIGHIPFSTFQTERVDLPLDPLAYGLSQDAHELLDLRTETTATFDLGDGKRVAVSLPVLQKKVSFFDRAFAWLRARSVFALDATGSPTTVISDDYGGSSEDWSNPSNAGSSDNSYATSIVGAGLASDTDWLTATNYGFDLSNVTSIDGFEVMIERKASVADLITDGTVELIIGGSEHSIAASGTTWSTSDATQTYGSSTNTWGVSAGSLTEANVESSAFGFRITAIGSDFEQQFTLSIDHISIKVYYSVDNPPTVAFSIVEGGGVDASTNNQCGGQQDAAVSTANDGDTFDVNITFSEDVTGFAIEDVDVSNPGTNSTAGSFDDLSDGDAATYRVTITPDAGFDFGLLTITVPADSAQDGGSNGNTVGTYKIYLSRWILGCCGGYIEGSESCTDIASEEGSGSKNVVYYDDDTGYPFAGFTINTATASSDLSSLTWGVDTDNSAAFFHSLNSLTGVTNICMYIPKDANHDYLRYCSGRQSATCTAFDTWHAIWYYNGASTSVYSLANGWTSSTAANYTVTVTTQKNSSCTNVNVWKICGPIASSGQGSGDPILAVPDVGHWSALLLISFCIVLYVREKSHLHIAPESLSS